jgi:hypothetical protein
MIDTQPQYIKLNISGEISIIVVQTHSGRKRDIYAHKRTYTNQKKRDIQAMVNNTFIAIVKRKGTHKQWSTTHLL